MISITYNDFKSNFRESAKSVAHIIYNIYKKFLESIRVVLGHWLVNSIIREGNLKHISRMIPRNKDAPVDRAGSKSKYLADVWGLAQRGPGRG